MAEAMKRVDAEPYAGDESLDPVQLRHGGEAAHVLGRSSEAHFVSAHEDVGPAIHEDNGADAQLFDKPLIRGAQRAYADLLDTHTP